MYSIRQVPMHKLEILGLLYFHSTFALHLAGLVFLPTAFPVCDIEVPQVCLPVTAWAGSENAS